MVYQIKDIQVWENLKKDLFAEHNCPKRDIPKRLRVLQKEKTALPSMLDLHGLTVQQAFEATAGFLAGHFRAGTKDVLIVTGKGTMGEGLIKKEFDGWLKNPSLYRYIRYASWQNRGGAVKITLKKK